MSIWQTLGIAPTGDLEAVKRAYAGRAKHCHPEEHPDEFRVLHEAYRQAIRYARQHPQTDAPPAPAPVQPVSKPAFKPSFHIPTATDNPARARQHRCSYDSFSAEQYAAMRRENKRASRPEPRRSLDSPALPHGKCRIRGAGTSPTPSGGLKFDAVDHPKPEEPPAAAPLPPPPIQQTPHSPSLFRRILGTVLFLCLCMLMCALPHPTVILISIVLCLIVVFTFLTRRK